MSICDVQVKEMKDSFYVSLKESLKEELDKNKEAFEKIKVLSHITSNIKQTIFNFKKINRCQKINFILDIICYYI